MSTKVASAARPQEVPVGDPQGTLGFIGEARGASLGSWAPEDVEAAKWFLQIVDRAQQRTGSFKQFHGTLKQDKSLTRRQLDGDGHLSAARLALLGSDFWLAVADEIRHHFGVVDRAELVAKGEALMDRARVLFAKAANL